MAKDKAEAKRKPACHAKQGAAGGEGMYSIIRRIVAVFTTFFVVIGVAMVGLFARDTMPELVEEIVSEATSTEVFAPAYMIVNGDTASLYKTDGEYIRDLVWPADTNIFSKPVSQLFGVDVMSGDRVWLANGFGIATSTKFRSPDGRRELRLESKRRDGSQPLVISYGNDDDVRVPRINGDLIKDIELIGWRDDKSVVFLGNATGSDVFFELDLGAAVSYIGPAEENGWNYQIYDDGIYYLKSDMREDDEEDFKVAPGSLNRVDMAGVRHELIGEDNSVIQSYALSEDKIVYALVDQSMVMRTGKNRASMGRCLPLMLVNDEVICRAGDGIEVRSVDGDPKRLFEAEEMGLFYLQKVRMGNE
jgi:hypothetical protein